MTIGELVEILIYLRNRYELSECEDEAVCDACNILDQFPRMADVYDTLQELKELNVNVRAVKKKEPKNNIKQKRI